MKIIVNICIHYACHPVSSPFQGITYPPPLRRSSPLRYLLSAACVKTITTFQLEWNFEDRFSSLLPVELNHPLAVLIMLNRLNYANSLWQARSLNSNQCHTNHISRRSSSNWSLKTDSSHPPAIAGCFSIMSYA